jgi:hypothetical protein
MEKSNKITIFSSIILVGFAVGVIYHYILTFYAHAQGVYSSFLYPSDLAFCDFSGSFKYIRDFKPYQSVNLWVIYFPFAYIFILPFAYIKNELLSYSIYISGFLTYLITMNIKMFSCKNLTKLQNVQNIFIITLLSYPVLYCLDKGNFDIYLFVLLGFWTFAFQKEKYKLSAVLLALINAMKPFTLYFLLLYLMKKRYKECILSILLTAFLIVGFFLIIPDNLSGEVSVFFQSLKLYKDTYTLSSTIGMGFVSSLFMPLKALFLHFSTDKKAIDNFIIFYDYLCQFITIIMLFFVWKEKTFWKQLTLLICNFLLLPYCTYDYKFIFLFIPIWLFINSHEKSRFDFYYLLLFALLFIPKNVIIDFPSIHGSVASWLSFSAIVNPIIMIALSGLIIFEQITKGTGKRKEETDD